MARLIPSFMDERTPPGERDVFNLLKIGSEDWVVLHSLDLAPWNRGLRTEIDFVVIIPDTGILCIEVKSHKNISFDGIRWFPDSIRRSPFKQASDGRFTFYRRLARIAPKFKSFPVVHCCIFTHSPFKLSPNLSVQAWELIDANAFREFKNASDFCNDLKSRIKKSIDADINLSNPQHQLSKSQINEIVSYCVPIQKFQPDTRQEIVQREKEIERILTEQQKPILQLSMCNDRIIITGGAGTGKTFIAMEVAQRLAEQGERVALLCFNQLIGEWMKQKMGIMKPALPNLLVGRAISVMAEMSEIQIPDIPSHDYWEVTLPNKIEERITDPDFNTLAAFDYLVLDEAQDVLARPRIWDCLSQFLSGGLETGKFVLLGDFEHQVLAGRESLKQNLDQLNAQMHPVKWELTENCRNYRIIGDTALRLSDLPGSVYSGYLRSGGGIHNYDIYFYTSEEEQLDKIKQYIREFKTKGYKNTEITLLSFRADRLSAATSLKKTGHKLKPAWQKGSAVSFTSVHAYKGLENKIVIITDVILDQGEYYRDLFYTGMTRATETIRVLCHEASKETIFNWLIEGN